MEKENSINDVLESTKGMRKAEPSPFLFEQITARIDKGQYTSVKADPFLKWGLTSLVLIMLSLNLISITKTKNTEVASQENSETTVQSYFNNATTYNYY
jgi:hypothetical protein